MGFGLSTGREGLGWGLLWVHGVELLAQEGRMADVL